MLATRSNIIYYQLHRTDVNSRPLNPPLQIRFRKKNGWKKILWNCLSVVKFYQISGVTIGWMKIFPGGNYPGGNFQVAIFRVGVILGGNFPGGSYPGWEISLVGVFRVGIVRGESSGWQFSGWEFSCYRFLISKSIYILKVYSMLFTLR